MYTTPLSTLISLSLNLYADDTQLVTFTVCKSS